MGNPANPAGYTSKYIDVDFTPEYPFGFGLSYTDVQYSDLRLSSPVTSGDQSITVSAEIANRGARTATETAQLYIRDLVASVAQPVRKLTAFQRLTLKPGESQDRQPLRSPRRTWRFTTNTCDWSPSPDASRSGSRPIPPAA